MARPISSDLPAIAALISAPEPASVQLHLPPESLSNQPSPFAIMVGFVSRKKPTRTVSGALPAASRERAGSPAVSAAPLMSAVFSRKRRSGPPLMLSDMVSSSLVLVARRSGTCRGRSASPSILARPMNDTMLDDEQEAIEHKAHDA